MTEEIVDRRFSGSLSHDELVLYVASRFMDKPRAGVVAPFFVYPGGEIDVLVAYGDRMIYVECKERHSGKAYRRAHSQVMRAINGCVVDEGLYVAQNKDKLVVRRIRADGE